MSYRTPGERAQPTSSFRVTRWARWYVRIARFFRDGDQQRWTRVTRAPDEDAYFRTCKPPLDPVIVPPDPVSVLE